jgi:histidyl-tRNA synthetase
VFRLIDKLDKLSPEAWAAYGKESIGLSGVQIDQLRGVLSDRDSWKQSSELTQFFDAMRDFGTSDYLEFDPSIVRGLAYYTGTVFEAWDRVGEFRAVLGGGRYDNLLADVGGERMGAIGFAMGDVVIGLLLEQAGLKPELPPSPTRVLVTVFAPDLIGASARIASQLRTAGINTELYPEPAKLDKQLKYANALGIPYAVIVGPDEAAAGKAMVKNLATGEQQQMDQGGVVEVVGS